MALDPRFTITDAVTRALTTIERARGFLEAAKLSEDWVAQMQARALVREAHHTTHIEGSQLTLDQSERLLSGQPVPEADPDDARELLNYREAFDLVAGYLGSGEPVTEGLIREIHKLLVQGVRGDAATPGAYRTVQNYVVNSLTGAVIYTPPPANEVPILMAELVTWLGSEPLSTPVLVAGVAQFQLVHIHPFLDGNGRSARLLSTLCLCRSGYDFKRLFTISEYYDRDRPAYYRAIQSVRECGMDLTQWLEYFTEGLATQMAEVQTRGEKVIRTDILAQKHGLSERQRDIIAFALEHPTFTIQDLELHFPDVARRTLQRDLKTLLEKALLVAGGATNQLVYSLPAPPR
ncbi:MAG TPA: Fic family protein [Acidobacteriota bacterium]|nr:Fic family protein [Acidobacteriota bacterium]